MYTGMGDMQYVIDNGGPGTPGSPNPYFNTKPVPGTGPYLVKAMSERSWVEFTQNPNYWGKNLNASEIAGDVLLDPGHVTNVIIYYKSDDIARFTDLKNGAAQIAAIQAADWAAVMTNPTTFSYVHLPPWAQYVFLLAFNTQIAPTNNVDFRQALVHAINYTDLNKKAFFSTASEFVPPEYPAYSNYYNLGNYQPYTYNLTLAKMYLAASKVNTTTMSPMVIRLVSGCPYCETSAEVIQQDFAQLNIPSNIVVLAPSAYYAPWGGYAYDVVPANAAQLGNINVNGGENWAPSALTPADSYVDWVSNGSLGTGDMAVYYNPIVQACVNSFFDGTSLANQQVICAKAQTQVYNDAPYTGYTLGLWWVDGSLTWLQNGPIKSFALDPMFVGETTAPIFNTVTFASSNTQGGSMSSIAPMFLVRDAQRSYGWLPVLSTKWQAT
jgi:ABC-type transport system substrate-binding protein